MRTSTLIKAVFINLALVGSCFSAVLPDERADAMYHSYNGGGMEISGPSVLVRKNIAEKYSVSANYYIDKVVGASIDVLTRASQYNEERTEYSVSADYIVNKTIMSGGYTASIENDYDAETFFFNISQDFFGDLTTVSMSYALGSDEITKTGDENFLETARRHNYSLSVSQIMTKNLIMSMTLNTITDQGFLNNPYRQVRYSDGAGGAEWQDERYPKTRTSTALGITSTYFLPYRAALKTGYRYFADTWDITAHTFSLGYTHPYQHDWIFDLRLRYYTQSQASFFSDLFPYQDAQNYLAHDKEMSEMTSFSIGAGVSYEYKPKTWAFINKVAANLQVEHIQFDYANFRSTYDSVTAEYGAGNEPFYEFSGNAMRFFVTAWF